MERESTGGRIKLTVVAGVDYPEATEILVSFPDKWQFVDQISREDETLYVGAMPPQEEAPRCQRFRGLPPELNEALNAYRLYKLFQPWPMPQLGVTWDAAAGRGRVEGMRELKVRLQPVGQAQVWQSAREAVLWECYLQESARKDDWQDDLAAFWRAVERDIAVATIFTQPHEPTFEESYTDFLRRLDYGPHPHHFPWWSKSVSR